MARRNNSRKENLCNSDDIFAHDMSNTKTSSDTNMRRSALSFASANASLDVDHVLQSEPWKNIAIFDESEAGCIQNILNDFNDKIKQEKILKADHTITKKSPRRSPRFTKKSPIKSPTKDSLTDLPETSSNMNNNVVETKTAVNKKRTKKSQQTSPETKTVEKMISQELPYDNEELQRLSKSNAEENNSVEQIIKNETLQNMNISKKDLQTSTPKKKIISKIRRPRKRGSTAENKEPKMKDSENKSKRDVQLEKDRKERQKISKKNTKDKQDKDNANMHDEKKKINMKLQNNNIKIKMQNNLECNNMNQDTSKNKVRKENEEECCATPLRQTEKKCKAKINCNMEKNDESKKCNKNVPIQLKRKQKKENPKDKLQKCTESKSLQINNGRDIKCQCKKSCAKDSGNQCCSKEQVKKTTKYNKNAKTAKADHLSRHVTITKKKIEINVDLESSDSGSSYTDESSYSTYSSDSRSYCSCTSTCSCSCWESDSTDYDSSDCLNSSKTNGNSKKNCCC